MLIGCPSVYDFSPLKVILIESCTENMITLSLLGWFLVVVINLLQHVQIIVLYFCDY